MSAPGAKRRQCGARREVWRLVHAAPAAAEAAALQRSARSRVAIQNLPAPDQLPFPNTSDTNARRRVQHRPSHIPSQQLLRCRGLPCLPAAHI
jgi:hypothetical protein